MTQRWSYLAIWVLNTSQGWRKAKHTSQRTLCPPWWWKHNAMGGGGRTHLSNGYGVPLGESKPDPVTNRSAHTKNTPCDNIPLIKSFIKILLQYCTPQLEPVLLLFYSKKKWKTQNLFRPTPGGGGCHPTRTAVGAEILPRACHKHTVASLVPRLEAIDLMHWRHKGSHLHNNDASLASRSAHVLCWQCALALSLSVRGPGRASSAVWLAGFAPLAACLAMTHVAVFRLTPNAAGRPSVTSYAYGLY